MLGPLHFQEEGYHSFLYQKRIRKTTHKYGTEIPTSAEHAHKIDQKNGYFGEMQSH